HILLPVHRIADRTCRALPAQKRMPKRLARLRVERKEIPFHAARKHQIPTGRKHSRLRIRHHWELPLLLTRLWIELHNRPVAFILGLELVTRAAPAARWPLNSWRRCIPRILLAFLPRSGIELGRPDPGILPRRNVEQPRPRTERRWIPIRAALRPRLD